MKRAELTKAEVLELCRLNEAILIEAEYGSGDTSEPKRTFLEALAIHFGENPDDDRSDYSPAP